MDSKALWLMLLAPLFGCGSPGSAAPAATPSDARARRPDVAVEPSRPHPGPAGTSLRFPAGWRGPCGSRAGITGGPVQAVYEYLPDRSCLVPAQLVVTGVYGCATSLRFTDEAAPRVTYRYDARGRMVEAGSQTFLWDEERLVAVESDGERHEVTRDGATVSVGWQNIVLREDGFPAGEHGPLGASTLVYDAERLVRIEDARFTVELDYCD